MYVVLREFQWQWKVCEHFMMPHLSFLGEVLKVEMCVMGVPSSLIDERGLGMVELEVVCMGCIEGCSRLLEGGGGKGQGL